jgi:uncharacterized protein with FMN-binding domain
MRSSAIHTPTVVLLAGLALAGSLAACSSPAPTPATGPDSGGAGTDSGAGTGDAGADAGNTGTASYADGTYSASGSYQAPSGTETVDVTVTLQGDVITDVQVVGEATDPQARQHQGEFAGGIAAEVVGKDIDEISVSRVAGSSLTSGGFNAAIETIKADAAA